MSDDEKEEMVDFAYAIDCTGSMGSYIARVQADISQIVTSMEKEFPEFKLRLACVGYRDWCDEKRLEQLSFTEDVGAFKAFVKGLAASGGGDAAEDVLGGLRAAAGLDWSSNLRVLYHICDAPPHGRRYHALADGPGWDEFPEGHPTDPADYHKAVIGALREKNVHLCIARLNDSVAKMIGVFQGYGRELEMAIEERSVSSSAKLLESVKAALKGLVSARKVVKQMEHGCARVVEALGKITFENEQIMERSKKAIARVEGEVVAIENDVSRAQDEWAAGKEGFELAMRESPVLLAYARQAKTEEEVEKAETELFALNDKLSGVRGEINAAQMAYNAALKRLSEQSFELARKEAEAMAHSREAGVKIEEAQAKIAQLKGALAEGKAAAVLNAKKAKKQMHKDIKKWGMAIQKILRDQTELNSQMSRAREKIIGLIKKARADKDGINEAIAEIDTELEVIEHVLENVGDSDDGDGDGDGGDV